MPFTTVKYNCTSKLQCSDSLPADVVICVSSDKTAAISGVYPDYIEGQITAVSSCPKSFNCCLYTYTLYFDTAQLREGESIDASDINGVFCKGCLSSFIESSVEVNVAAHDCGSEANPCADIWTYGDLVASEALPGTVGTEPLGPIGRQIGPRQYIIQFGYGKIPSYFLANIAVMEATPFDGSIMEFTYTDPVHGLIDGVNNICNSYPIPYSLLAPNLADLQVTNFVKFTQMFMRMNIAAAFSTGYHTTDVNSYSDVTAFLHNIAMVTRLAKEGRLRGILFDTELYNSSKFWNYQYKDQSFTFAQYQEKYRKLGLETIAIIEKEFYNCDILCFPGYDQLRNGPTDLSQNNYGLMPAFLNGMHDGTLGITQLVNATELGYGHRTAADWDYDVAIQTLPTIPTPVGSANYNRAHETSISTWLDYPGTGFDFVNVNLNYFTPNGFRDAIIGIAARVPRYIVVYGQTPKFWGFTPGVDQMPYAYVQALGEARTAIGIGGEFSIADVPGIKAYYNPFDLTLNDNDPVSTFPDSVGSNDLIQSNPALQPTFKANGFGSGLPSVNFVQASTQYLENISLAAYNVGTDVPYTMLAVTKFVSNTPGSTCGLAGFRNDLGLNAENTFGVTFSSHWFSARRGNLLTAHQINSPVLTTSAPFATSLNIFSVRFDGVNGDAAVNGVSVIAPATLQIFPNPYTTTVFDLGRGATQFMNGDIGAFVYCDQYLQTADYISLIRYIGFLYGITITV